MAPHWWVRTGGQHAEPTCDWPSPDAGHLTPGSFPLGASPGLWLMTPASRGLHKGQLHLLVQAKHTLLSLQGSRAAPPSERPCLPQGWWSPVTSLTWFQPQAAAGLLGWRRPRGEGLERGAHLLGRHWPPGPWAPLQCSCCHTGEKQPRLLPGSRVALASETHSPPAVPGWPHFRLCLTASQRLHDFLRKINIETLALGKSQKQHSAPRKWACCRSRTPHSAVRTRRACGCPVPRSPTGLRTLTHTHSLLGSGPSAPPRRSRKAAGTTGGPRAWQEAERRPGETAQGARVRKGAGEKTRERNQPNSGPGGRPGRAQPRQRVSGGLLAPAPSPLWVHSGLLPGDGPEEGPRTPPLAPRHPIPPSWLPGSGRRGQPLPPFLPLRGNGCKLAPHSRGGPGASDSASATQPTPTDPS